MMATPRVRQRATPLGKIVPVTSYVTLVPGDPAGG
jgi:hypothetical protein